MHSRIASTVLLLCLLCLPLGPIGCTTTTGAKAHPEAIAKKSLEGVADSVDVAMKVWARYVVTNKLTVEQQKPVREAHDRYRLMMDSAVEVIKELRKNPQPNGYESATRVAAKASDELIKLIYSYTE